MHKLEIDRLIDAHVRVEARAEQRDLSAKAVFDHVRRRLGGPRRKLPLGGGRFGCETDGMSGDASEQ